MSTIIEGSLQTAVASVVVVDEADRADSIAQQLFNEIASLEREVQHSKNLVREIENRGWWGRVKSNTTDDLAKISRTQSAINKKMVDLIRQTIQLNMLSHAGLIHLMNSLQEGIKNGFVDAHGKIKRLSEEGVELAEAASVHLSGLIDASNSTKDQIERSSSTMRQQNLRLEEKTKLDAHQSRLLALLAKQVKEKGDLDARQQVSIDEQGLEIDRLTVQVALLSEQLRVLETIQQQYQDGVEVEVIRISRRVRFWQWSILSLAIILVAWLALLTLKPSHHTAGEHEIGPRQPTF